VSVEYVLVGAYAAMSHGALITTQDVDVCAPLGRPNLDRIVEALRDLHPYFRFRPDSKIALYDDPARLVGFKNLNLVTDWGVIDILGDLPDVATYDQIASKAIPATFGRFTCPLIDLETLIAAKRGAGRPKDQLHLRYLEEIQRREKQQPRHLNDIPDANHDLVVRGRPIGILRKSAPRRGSYTRSFVV
jgi:hypothetical protein